MLLATAVLSQSTLRFVVLGMATGALTALVALSVVIVYRVSGVLNFAAGALGAVGAFVCYWLRDDIGWPAPLAIAAGLVVGTVLGLLTYAVLALLRESSLLSKLIATLALLSVAQGTMNVIWDDQTSQPKPFLPSRTITLFGEVRIGQDRLILIGLALALAVALGVFYNRTLFGLATSAVSENRRVAAMARWAPARIELVNFMIAGFLAALAAILLAPIVTLNGAILALAVLPALAAALVGRFSSFAVTVAAALVIGILQSEISLFQPDIAGALDVSPPSLTGLVQAVPLLVILVVTVLSGRVRPAGGEAAARLPLPGSGRVSWPVLAVGIAAGIIAIATADNFADAFITTLGMAIIVASVIVVTGYAGQLSLCQYALAGFGAWVAARMANSFDTGFLVAVVIGVVASVLVGVLVALPAIRTRGVTLAIVTLALALVFNALIFQNAGMTGGFDGIVVKSPEIFGFDLDPVHHPQRYAGLLLLAFIVVAWMVSNLRVGATGRQMIAVRSNERAAAALGISVVGIKVYAFAVGAGIAGLGGILLAFRQSNVQFGDFNVFGSILLVQYAVIGGIGWISGAVLGAAAAPGGVIVHLVDTVLPHLAHVESWLIIVSGVLAIQLLRRAPDGMASLWAGIARRLLHRERKPAAAATGAPARPRVAPTGRELEVRGVTVRFGGVVAVDDVSFRASPGEIVGLIGPNGAGKTTLLDVITGFTRQQGGTVLLDGTDVSAWRPERRARAGIARSWQAVELFDELTVRDNLLVAEESRSRWQYPRDLVRRNRRALSDFGESVVDDLGLRAVLDQRPPSLPLGLVKLVGIARTIIANPGVILLDEPAAGLDNEESRELAVLIRGIATRHHVAVVVIEHDMALIASTCDRVVVLDFGHKIADGTPDQIQNDTIVVKAYLGEPTPVPALAGTAAPTEDA
jgi:ABC-type branched-subunit amino acid transport system ATPase component/ABC-type branched-subunit amino acid transport system permease subunit